MKPTHPPLDNNSGAREEWRAGWPVVLSAGVGYGTGAAMIVMLASLFIRPMHNALGWSTTAVTIAPIITLVWAFCYPPAGLLIDRLGSRRVAIFGAIGLAACTALLAVVPITAFTLYGIAVLIGIFCSLTAVPTYTRGIASWFRSGAGLAFGLTLSGATLISIFATPLTGMMIEANGWRAGYWVITAIIMLIGVPVVAMGYRERPAPIATKAQSAVPVAGFTIREAARDCRLWYYTAAFTIACIPLGGFVAHFQPMMADKGFALPQALTLGVIYALSMGFGRVVGGFLLDRFWPYTVAAITTFMAMGGAIGLAYGDAGTGLFFVALMTWLIGMAQGAEGDFMAFFSLRSFGIRAFATIVGVLGMTASLGMAAGAFAFSLIFDAHGSYFLACYMGAVCLFLSGIIIFLTGLAEQRSVRQGEFAIEGGHV